MPFCTPDFKLSNLNGPVWSFFWRRHSEGMPEGNPEPAATVSGKSISHHKPFASSLYVGKRSSMLEHGAVLHGRSSVRRQPSIVAAAGEDALNTLVRDRICLPPPHMSVHRPHSDHSSIIQSCTRSSHASSAVIAPVLKEPPIFFACLPLCPGVVHFMHLLADAAARFGLYRPAPHSWQDEASLPETSALGLYVPLGHGLQTCDSEDAPTSLA